MSTSCLTKCRRVVSESVDELSQKMCRRVVLFPEQRRSLNRLVFMYKVVKALVPAIPVDDFLKQRKPKRRIGFRKYSDHISKNIVDRHSVNNNRCLVIASCKTEQLKQSFFVWTLWWSKGTNRIQKLFVLRQSRALETLSHGVTRQCRSLSPVYNAVTCPTLYKAEEEIHPWKKLESKLKSWSMT